MERKRTSAVHGLEQRGLYRGAYGPQKSLGRRGWQRMRWLDSITESMGMNLSKLQEIVEDGGAWQAIVHGVANSRAELSD